MKTKVKKKQRILVIVVLAAAVYPGNHELWV